MTAALIALLVLAGGAAAFLLARLRAARGQAADLIELLDAVEADFVLYDRDDRIVHASRGYRERFAALGPGMPIGARFEEVARAMVEHGLVPEAAGREAEWLAERLSRHRDGGRSVRAQRDGSVRRVTERLLPGGRRVGFGIDVSDLVGKEAELEAARSEAQRQRRILEEAIEALPAGFVLYDAEDRLLLANSAVREMFPRIAEQLSRPGARWEDLVRINAAAEGTLPVAVDVEGWIERRRLERQRPMASATLDRGEGRWLQFIERRSPSGLHVGVRVDVSDAVRQRDAAEQASARLQDAIEALPDGFVLYDREDRLVLCNQRYREIYAESAPAMVEGASFEAILRYGLARGQYPQAAGREDEWLRERLRAHREPREPVLQELPGNRWLRIDERVTRDGGVAGVRTEVTELVRREQSLQLLNAQLDVANQQLELLSGTDGLTGIANRRVFDRRLDEEWRRARRLAHPLALLLLDVDYFKRYNDVYGHLRGDDCLRQVAALLASTAHRGADVVARYGGEEFAVLLPNTDLEAARAVAARCLQAIDAAGLEHRESPLGRKLTLSVGAACARGDALQGAPESLVAAADAALYRAKQGGRHRVEAAPPLDAVVPVSPPAAA